MILRGTLFLFGMSLWLLLRQPIPESGFFYKINDGDSVSRVQGTFKSSPVEADGLNSVEGINPRFMAWIAITPSNSVSGEPMGICFFDDDGDFSGFLPVGESSRFISSVRVDDKALFLTVSDDQGIEEIRFSVEEADILWPK